MVLNWQIWVMTVQNRIEQNKIEPAFVDVAQSSAIKGVCAPKGNTSTLYKSIFCTLALTISVGLHNFTLHYFFATLDLDFFA